MNRAISWFAENHVAANLLMLLFIIAGLVSLRTIKLEVFPETALDKISITVEYPGASPSEVEEGVIRRIEEKISGIAGIDRMDSTAREGVATITLDVIKGWDVKSLLDEVKAEVDRITTLPEEAEKPVVREIVQRVQVINAAVYGDVPERSLKDLAEKIRDEMTSLPGVTQAEMFGVRKGEIHVEISEEVLRKYGLTLGQVAEIIRKASFDLPAGSVKTEGGEILIRTKGRRYYAPEYGDIAVLSRPDGSKVTLDQIAALRDGLEDVDLFARFRGKPAAVIQVFRVADQNALDVAQKVKAYIEGIHPGLPAGVEVAFFADMSEILESRLDLLLRNMAFGLVLVILLLGLFLNVRLAFWVTLGIPVSFLAALAVLPQFDVSINMISLFAFIMVLGIVVDDAIVIGENIFRKQEEGLPALDAARKGAIEVGRPVVFSVLTTVVAFWPLLLGSGAMGKLIRNLPIVVILVLMGSLIESLWVLPAHLSGGGPAPVQKREIPWIRRRLQGFISGPYCRAVRFCLRWRYATVAAGMALLFIALGMVRGGIVPFTFFPKVESDTLDCSVTMPAGTSVERTVDVVNTLEKAARDVLAEADRQRPPGAPPLYQHSISLIGTQVGGRGDVADVGGHLAQIWIQVLAGEKRDVSTNRLVALWRERAGAIPDAESITFKSELHSMGKSIEVHLALNDQEALLMAAEELKGELRHFPGVFDIGDSFLPGKLEMQLKLKPAARSLGLTLNDLAQQVRHAFYGAEALRLQRDRDEVKVMVRYPERERNSLRSVEDMRIRTPEGQAVPFRSLADVTLERGYAVIQRTDRNRVIKVTADVDETMANANDVRTALESGFLPDLKSRYGGLRYSVEGEGKEQRESLQDVMNGFLLALFGIYALLAIPFRSFSQPFIVMAAIPFGIVGAVLGHLIMGFPITILSLFGVVGLAGVVVNDSLVLIDATNRIREEGSPPDEAVARAGMMRFRAILLTSLTTFAGLMPMILERSLQARFLIPMAISLGYGVLFATVITLLLIPCLYIILEDFRNFLSMIFKKIL